MNIHWQFIIDQVEKMLEEDGLGASYIMSDHFSNITKEGGSPIKIRVEFTERPPEPEKSK